MCTVDGVMFGATNLLPEDIKDKDILEVGSYDVNGSLKPLLSIHQPKSYIGVDIEAGPNVDEVCKAEELVKRFGNNRFDVVIATELIEHTRYWRETISNIKQVCKPEGIILVTTRSKGFRYHGYPDDYWRYEIKDFQAIFSDCEIVKMGSDSKKPGVFIKVIKPANFTEKDLSLIKLYSIVTRTRTLNISTQDIKKFRRQYLLRTKTVSYLNKIAGNILKPWR
ncbi:MAG: methyltransferase domain-containing protein [bacterium]|nr:methyltransferase domain-containing protein [bacterium]